GRGGRGCRTRDEWASARPSTLACGCGAAYSESGAACCEDSSVSPGRGARSGGSRRVFGAQRSRQLAGHESCVYGAYRALGDHIGGHEFLDCRDDWIIGDVLAKGRQAGVQDWQREAAHLLIRIAVSHLL